MDKCYQYVIIFLIGIIAYYFLFNNDLVEGFERQPVKSLDSIVRRNVLLKLNEGFRFNKGIAYSHPLDADDLPKGVDIVYHETEDGNRGHYYVPPNDGGGFYSVADPDRRDPYAGNATAIEGPVVNDGSGTGIRSDGWMSKFDYEQSDDPERFELCSKNENCSGFNIARDDSAKGDRILTFFYSQEGLENHGDRRSGMNVKRIPMDMSYTIKSPLNVSYNPKKIYYKLNEGEELIIEVEQFKVKNGEFEITPQEYTSLSKNNINTIDVINKRLDEAYETSESCKIPENDEVYDYSDLTGSERSLKNAILKKEDFNEDEVKRKIGCKFSPGTFATGVECKDGVVTPKEGACITAAEADVVSADSQKCKLSDLNSKLQGKNIKVRESMMQPLYDNYSSGFTSNDTSVLFSYLTCKNGYQGNFAPSNIVCNSSNITIIDPCNPVEVDNRRCLDVDTTKNNCSNITEESNCHSQDGCYYGSDSDSQLTSLRSSNKIQDTEDSLLKNLLGTVGGQNPGKLIPKSIEDETELRKQYGIYGELEVLRRELIKQNDLEIQKLSDSLTVATCESDNCGHGIKKGVTRMSIDIPNKMVNGLISSSAFNNQQMLQDIREMVDQEAASTNNNTTNTNTP